MSRVTIPIILSAEERTALAAWSSSRSLPFRLVQCARIISMAAGVTLGQDIAHALHIPKSTVQLWRERFLALRLAGLGQRPSPVGGVARPA